MRENCRVTPGVLFITLLTMTAKSAIAQSPSQPENVRALIYSDTAAELFWDRSIDDDHVRAYNITRNNISIGERDALSLFENDLIPGLTYQYSISAVDSQGNRSPSTTLALVSGEGIVENAPVPSVQLPENLRAQVYSSSATELFWDRADAVGLVYRVKQDNISIGDTDGTSYFIDGLSDTAPYEFAVQAVDATGATSATATVLVNTGQRSEPSVPLPVDEGMLKNVSLAIYSDNAAELTWDRPVESADIVSVEVLRSGTSLGTTFGSSYFDDTRLQNSNQTYELLVTDSNGNQTLGATIGKFEVSRLDTGVGDAAYGNYGHVSLSGDTAILPADRESIDGGLARTGAVYVFTRSAARQWQQTQKLVADADGGGGFGLSTAIDGNTLAIGQRFIPASDNVGRSRGGVTVYSRDANGLWSDAQTLVVDAGERVYRIGNALAIDGNTMMVGANNDTGPSPLFVFQRDDSGQWSQTQELTLDYDDSELGTAIAIEGDTAILGDYRDPSSGFLSGAAWIYNRNSDGTWSRGQQLLPSAGQEGDFLGTSVGLAGDTAVIGGVNTPIAFVFTRTDEGQWTETQTLAFDVQEYQGTFVDLDDETLVVGTPDASRLGYLTGSVQVFSKSGGQWYETSVLGSSDGQQYFEFGEAVSIDGNTVISGALINASGSAAIGTTAYIHQLD